MKTNREKIKEVRAELGLSQEDFAEDIDFSYSQYNKAESGQVDVSIKLMKKIIDRYQLDPGYFNGNAPLKINRREKEVKNESSDGYVQRLIDRLERELHDWKQEALDWKKQAQNLSQAMAMGKLNAVVNAGDNKRSLAAA